MSSRLFASPRGAAGDELLLSIANLSKEYPPPGSQRAKRFFARLGGIQPDPFAAAPGGDEDDEDDLGEEDEGDRTSEGLGGLRVIDGVSLVAYGGSHVALVGPPDAGKTVLLKLIGGIVPPSGGRVVVRGLVATALTVLARGMPKGLSLRRALPYVAATVGVPPRSMYSRLDEIAEFLEFPQLRRSWTTGLDKRQRNEVLLAAMLSIEPDIILTDIPIAHDGFGKRCIERLEDLRARGSLVITESRNVQSVVPKPDRVVFLERGGIVEE